MNTAEATPERLNINEMSLEQKKLLMQSTYTEKSYFQRLFNQDQLDLPCKPHALAFRQEIERILIGNNLISHAMPLENLHEVMSDDMRAYNFDDGVNKISTYFYDTDAQFKAVYYRFIGFVRENYVKEPFWFQATPTIRIHCPDARNSHHYPRYHSDISYGHPPQEINFWLPLTDILSGHGFRVMSLESSVNALKKFDYDFSAFIHSAIQDKDFSKHCESLAKPAPTEFGNVLAFDSRCIHSGEPLKKHTRISMDIRVLPLSQYKNMDVQYQGSGRRKIIFAPGHCYHEQNSDYFLNYTGK